MSENTSTEPPPLKIEEIATPQVLNAIVKGYKPYSRLLNWRAKPGSEEGEGYCSVMYALKLDLASPEGSTETFHLMLKTAPTSAFQVEMMKETKAFEKEVMIYNKVFPLLEETEKQLSSSDRLSLWPRCFSAYSDEEAIKDYVALENLKVEGYKLIKTFGGVDYKTAALILQHLARFHAVSFARYGGSQEAMISEFPLLARGMFNGNYQKLVDAQFQYMTHELKTQAATLREVGDEESASKLEKMADFNFQTRFKELLGGKSENQVIAHGDFWINNIMLKFEQNIPTHVKFFDFQLTQSTSRLVDVYYFLFTSVQLQVLEKREQDLLRTYYTEFTNHADKLGVDTKERGLTLKAFLEEAEKYLFFGVFMGVLLVPMLAMNKEGIADFRPKGDLLASTEDEEKWVQDFLKEKCVEKLQIIVRKFLPTCPESKHF